MCKCEINFTTATYCIHLGLSINLEININLEISKNLGISINVERATDYKSKLRL